MTNRRGFIRGAGAVALALPFIQTARADVDSREAWQRAADIARNVKPPTFPDRVFDIRNSGAVADGKTLATRRIAKAIDACAAAGGGRVLVPAGNVPHGCDPPQEQRGAARRRRRDAAVRHQPRELSHRVHALGRHGAHELLAAHLRAATEEHRHHGQGHARRAGQRASLVVVEGQVGRHDAVRLEGRHAQPAAGAHGAVPHGGR